MKRYWISVLLALLTMLVLAVGVAAASDKDKGQATDRVDLQQWRDSDERHWYVRQVSDHPDGDDQEHGNPHRDVAQRDQDGDAWARHGYREGTPPGWGHGQKKGWGNCGMPPGQAKKYGCDTYVYKGKQYDYFHDEAGHWRWRPHVSAHGGVDVRY